MLLALESSEGFIKPNGHEDVVQTIPKISDELEDSNPSLDYEQKEAPVAFAPEIDKVFVRMGESIREFTIVELKELPYFDSLFSQRWMEHHKIQAKNVNEAVTINVFGSDENNIPQFDCLDLHLLLLYKTDKMEQFYKHFGCNPIESNHIDKLLFCGDYFNCPIEKEMVTYLIQSRRPPLSQNDIKLWVTNEAKHCTLKQALCDLIESRKEQVSSLKNVNIDIINNSNVKKGDKLSVDADTAALMFSQMLESVEFTENNVKGELKVVIKKFNKKDWNELLKLFDLNKYSHYWKKSLSKIICNLQDCSHYTKLDINFDDMSAIWQLLKNIDIGKNNHPNQPFFISTFARMKSQFVIAICGGYYTRNTSQAFLADFLQLKIKQKHEFTLLTLKSVQRFSENVGRSVEKDCKTAIFNLFKFIQLSLSHCDSAFIVTHSHLWFPILHKKQLVPSSTMSADDNQEILKKLAIVSYVLNIIIPKLTTQQAFEFGLYLVDYAVFEKNDCNGTLDQQYVSYLKKVGIEWNILPQ